LAPADTITVVDVGERCHGCFNAEMADRLGVDLAPSSFQPVELTGADGVPHTFQIRSMLLPTGHELEALESAPAEGGHRFAVLGDFETDASELFQKLYENGAMHFPYVMLSAPLTVGKLDRTIGSLTASSGILRRTVVHRCW
jgi:hypothetical protein